MSIRTVVVSVLVIVLAAGTVLARAQKAVNDPDAVRAYAETLGLGSFVRVTLTNGSRVDGVLTQVTLNVLWVRPRTRIQVEPFELPLANIKSIEPRKPGWSAGKKVLVGVGIGAAVITALLVLAAVQLAKA